MQMHPLFLYGGASKKLFCKALFLKTSAYTTIISSGIISSNYFSYSSFIIMQMHPLFLGGASQKLFCKAVSQYNEKMCIFIVKKYESLGILDA